MRWHWQKNFTIGRGYLMFTIGQGFGLGAIYTTANLTLIIGPLMIDVTVPTPLWWKIVHQERETKQEDLCRGSHERP